MSTQVNLSKAYIVDESDSPLTAIRKINQEILMLEGLVTSLKRAKIEIEKKNRDYLEILKEFI